MSRSHREARFRMRVCTLATSARSVAAMNSPQPRAISEASTTDISVRSAKRQDRHASLFNGTASAETPVFTVRCAAEIELFKAQQLLKHLGRVAKVSEISGALAHELQQPLTSILCNAQAAQHLIAKETIDIAELRSILRDIVTEDTRAGNLIQRLRALLVRGETQFQRLDVLDMIQGVALVTRQTLMQRKLNLCIHVDQGLPPILGDRVELEQVLLNLIINAGQSMEANAPNDRRIEVTAALAAARGAVQISVFDCGTGIDTGRLETIFDPFVTTKKDGMGVGLAICRSIIAAHKGSLWAANRIGRGAVFHFKVPIA